MEWVDPVIQLVTAGGFGALVWYLVLKHIPAIEERHRTDMEKAHLQHATERESWEQRYREERNEWLKHLEKRDEQFDQFLRGKFSKS